MVSLGTLTPLYLHEKFRRPFSRPHPHQGRFRILRRLHTLPYFSGFFLKNCAMVPKSYGIPAKLILFQLQINFSISMVIKFHSGTNRVPHLMNDFPLKSIWSLSMRRALITFKIIVYVSDLICSSLSLIFPCWERNKKSHQNLHAMAVVTYCREHLSREMWIESNKQVAQLPSENSSRKFWVLLIKVNTHEIN